MGSSKGDAIIGAFQFLVIGVRQDITVETSKDGVLTDDDGTIIANAFEQDLTLVRAHARFACAIGKPVSPSTGQPITPFATAEWTSAAATASASASAPRRKAS